MAALSQLIALLMTVSETICNEGNDAATLPVEGNTKFSNSQNLAERNVT
jgi:hypothetical protein